MIRAIGVAMLMIAFGAVGIAAGHSLWEVGVLLARVAVVLAWVVFALLACLMVACGDGGAKQ